MAMDAPGVLHELPTLMAGLCPDMVADSLQSRGSQSRELFHSERNVHPVHRGHSRIHQLLPLLDRDSTHDRVTNRLKSRDANYIGSVIRTNFRGTLDEAYPRFIC